MGDPPRRLPNLSPIRRARLGELRVLAPRLVPLTELQELEAQDCPGSQAKSPKPLAPVGGTARYLPGAKPPSTEL